MARARTASGLRMAIDRNGRCGAELRRMTKLQHQRRRSTKSTGGVPVNFKYFLHPWVPKTTHEAAPGGVAIFPHCCTGCRLHAYAIGALGSLKSFDSKRELWIGNSLSPVLARNLRINFRGGKGGQQQASSRAHTQRHHVGLWRREGGWGKGQESYDSAHLPHFQVLAERKCFECGVRVGRELI